MADYLTRETLECLPQRRTSTRQSSRSTGLRPFLDAMLPDGSRLPVVIPDITRAHWSVKVAQWLAVAGEAERGRVEHRSALTAVMVVWKPRRCPTGSCRRSVPDDAELPRAQDGVGGQRGAVLSGGE